MLYRVTWNFMVVRNIRTCYHVTGILRDMMCPLE